MTNRSTILASVQRFLLAVVAAACVSGCGGDEETQSPVQRPAAPGNLQAGLVTASSVTLTWSDQSSDEDGFKIFRGSAPDSVTQIGVVGGGSTVYADEALDDTATYFYRVYSYNGIGDSEGFASTSATTYLKRVYQKIDTYIGTGACYGEWDGSPRREANLCQPVDVTFGPDGRCYIVDWNSHVIRVCDGVNVYRLIGLPGRIGDAVAGMADTVQINHPTNISFDPQGNLILSAWHNSKIVRMNMATGYIEPIVGTGARCFDTDEPHPAATAMLNLPVATAFDPLGRMYILDMANQRIRMVDENGLISTVVGATALSRCATCMCAADTTKPGEVFLGAYGGDDGPAIDGLINMPVDQNADPRGRMEIDGNGNLYIADPLNHRVRKIDAGGIIRTVAGNGIAGYAGDGGPATQASLEYPSDIAVDDEGNLFIADMRNHCVRMVDTNGIIKTIAGTPDTFGYQGDGGLPTEARLYRPYGVALDEDGNVYIADTWNNVIRVVYK